MDALAAAAAQLGGRAAVIRIYPQFRHGPPIAELIDAEYLERAGKRVGRGEAIRRSQGASINLLELLDDHGLRAYRWLRQEDVDEDVAVSAALQKRLDELPTRRMSSATSPTGTDEPPQRPEITAPPADQAGFDALLRAYDLPKRPGGLGTRAAAWRNGPLAAGGLPDLDREWPSVEGELLVHLATIALDELPPIEGARRLPATGSLVFFAALSEEAELWESAPCDDASAGRACRGWRPAARCARVRRGRATRSRGAVGATRRF